MAGKGKALDALSDLTPDPRNARRHTDRNVGMIRDALAEVGAARSIVIDERGVILAGNATAKAATEAGLKLQVVDADGQSIVAVRRSNLTAKQKARLALFDNRAAEEAEWDVDVLSGLKDDGLLEGMWSSEELEALTLNVNDIEFPEYDESAGDAVQMATCPHCGKDFPK